MNELKNESIKNGNCILGIEFGSTRIKSVLLDQNNETIVTGSHSWENSYNDGIWTYSLDEIWEGLQSSYSDLVKNVKEKYGVEIKKIASIGISAMMHGYLVFDQNDNLLVPFRTWRNNITEEASKKLREVFEYPIPQRWSISHLYQAILNGEDQIDSKAVVVFDEYGPVRMIRNKTWKYIHRYPYGPNELYDLKNDPEEINNLINDDYKGIISEMKDKLEKWFIKYAYPEVDGSREGVYGRGQKSLSGVKSKGAHYFKHIASE